MKGPLLRLALMCWPGLFKTVDARVTSWSARCLEVPYQLG
jgi:hypothetical protein